MHQRFLIGLLLATACGGGPEPAEPAVRRDVDSLGVTVVRHNADAFARAPQWSVEPTPVVVYQGVEGDEFDLTYVFTPVRLSDGRLLAVNRMNGGRLLLFDASGKPARVLAGTGSGPGELMAPLDPLLIGGDTIAVSDESNNQVMLFTPDAGFIRSLPLAQWPGSRCATPSGMLTNGRVVRISRCFGEPPPGRFPTLVTTTALDLSAPDTVAVIPGLEFVAFETRFAGVRRPTTLVLRFTRGAMATAWDASIATASGEGGYVVERRGEDGAVQVRIVVDVPRRPVTDSMRNALIDIELMRLAPGREQMVDIDESRRQAREAPFADSLPPYQGMVAVPGGWLWMTDGQAPGDSSWSATAFTKDGDIAARLTVPGEGIPIWYDADHVMVRKTDDIGLVRFALYRLKKTDGD